MGTNNNKTTYVTSLEVYRHIYSDFFQFPQIRNNPNNPVKTMKLVLVLCILVAIDGIQPSTEGRSRTDAADGANPGKFLRKAWDEGISERLRQRYPFWGKKERSSSPSSPSEIDDGTGGGFGVRRSFRRLKSLQAPIH